MAEWILLCDDEAVHSAARTVLEVVGASLGCRIETGGAGGSDAVVMDVPRERRKAVAELLRVIRRPRRRTRRHEVRWCLAAVARDQNVVGEYQSLASHQRAVIAERAQGESLERFATVVVTERLADDVAPDRRGDDAVAQRHECGSAVRARSLSVSR